MPESLKRIAPVSVRLSVAQFLRLEHERGGMSRSAYIKWRMFDPALPPPPRHRNKAPVQDHQALAALMGRLGKSRIANNLNQLAKAAHSGSLPVSDDVAVELREAVAEIAYMRTLLMTALGLRDGGP